MGCHKVFKWCLKDALNMLFKHFPLLNCTHKALLRYIYACLKLFIDVFLPCVALRRNRPRRFHALVEIRRGSSMFLDGTNVLRLFHASKDTFLL